MKPLTSDAVKFLKLLLSECGGGPSEHSWRRCRRCIAFNELENHQPLARRYVEEAIRVMEKRSDGQEEP